MKNRFTKYLLIVIVVCVMVLSGCAKQLSHETIGETLEYLSSDELEGRLAGSKGNLKTQEFIINSLEKYNIEKYNGSYNDTFSYEVVDPIETFIWINDKKLIENKDYVVRYYNYCFGEHPITTKNKIEEKCVLLLDEGDRAYDYYTNTNVVAIIKHSTIPVAKTMTLRNKLIISVDTDIYNYLLDNVGEQIDITSKFNVLDKKENNIVGMIKGKEAKKAIVISAHFDHIGKVNDHVFNGALDNASGTAAVLEIAKILSKKIEENEYPVDIYFAFFNAEELGLYGSRGFADEIQRRYGKMDVLNINIDCVGDKHSKIVNVHQNQKDFSSSVSEILIQDLKTTDTNIMIPQKYSGNSDHRWFENHIFICRTTDYIHTTEDTVDKLDENIIKQLSESVSDAIVEFLDESSST